MRALISAFVAALLLTAAGCAKKDDTATMPAPADQPTDTAPAPVDTPPAADPNATGEVPPSDTGTPTGDTAAPPPAEDTTTPPQQ